MERFLCIHGHFYQPPRENPWLEMIEVQDSAYPYHDWNERISAECYAPNSAARILTGDGRIAQLVNNYARISFNFGPTLLSWLEQHASNIYRALQEADRESQKNFGGHGSALAQAYNHVILPLADRQDKYTQVVWGLRDFEHRFGRKAEGLWLPETAVDRETLEVLAELGMRFTILAPAQAGRVRKLGEDSWQDARGGKIDPTRAYLQRLPSGKSIALFFYDGPISRAIAFEGLLAKGEQLAGRLLSGFSDERDWPQLVHIATDGESYGHHHAHGDMALAYALHHIEKNRLARLTNYGEFLEKFPPTYEVDILENTAWSCAHGIERWRSDCGCGSGRAGWNQAWRAPLREALDTLRDALKPAYEKKAGEIFRDPWAARNEYINVLLDRGPEQQDRFLEQHTRRQLSEEDRVAALKLLELQRNALLMYTSCGWFFDEISGLEGTQVLLYAGRALQLGQELLGNGLEETFLRVLERAQSNLPEHQNGRVVFEKFVRPAWVTPEKLAAFYAVRSLFEDFPPEGPLFCYQANREAYQAQAVGKTKFVAGRVRLISEITRESATLSFAALSLGDHNVHAGVRPWQEGQDEAGSLSIMSEAFERADFPQLMRLLVQHYGESTYSLESLFRDEQRRILKQVLRAPLAEAESAYRRVYEQHLPLMRFLAHLGSPMPRAFQTAAEFLFNTDLRWALDDDDPEIANVRRLLSEAAAWHVSLDGPGLGYRFTKTMERMAQRWRALPTDLEPLQKLDAAVELGRSLPFPVNLWTVQNLFFEVRNEAFPAMQEKAAGDEAARQWLEVFVRLGERLQIQVTELHQRLEEVAKAPTIPELVRDAFAQARVPGATYRFQFHAEFHFSAATELVPYLADLGITDLYASPILEARAGSTHCYDLCNPGKMNPDLGGEPEFEALTQAVKKLGLGLLVDIVPNHMGIGDPRNLWWNDVLENGVSSVYANYFDIDWHPSNPNLNNKLLLPVLGDQYGQVLEQGQIQLGYDDGAFFLRYYQAHFPVDPGTYPLILEQLLPRLIEKRGEEQAQVQELKSILTALSYLPARTELPREKVLEKNREKEVVKRRLATLIAADPEITAALDAMLQQFNGKPGTPPSFDLLDRLVESQAYRLAYWRVATEEINYRRFFDINELAAIRMEDSEVFQAAHALLLPLLAEGRATGLRIDHPDGLFDPTEYFRQLQKSYLEAWVRRRLPEERQPVHLAEEVAAEFAALSEQQPKPHAHWPLFVVAEKILSEDEPLPTDWEVYGTTGYDFLNQVNGLFVDDAQREAFDRIYSRFIGTTIDFQQLVRSTKTMILQVSMASEINALSHQLDRISEGNRRYRDFTLNSLALAVREIIACLRVYRTYITSPEVALRDRLFIEEAVAEAKRRNPRTAAPIFDFIRDSLLLRNLEDFREEDRPRLIAWSKKFQQLSGPTMAKGVEDTAFYIYNRLVSLNEVGGQPDQFGVTPALFHQQNVERRDRWPHSLLALSTHDTKRSEDVRARINVLSEVPQLWEEALQRWSTWNESKKGKAAGQPAPDRNDEYLLYQTLLGAWPQEAPTPEGFANFRDRITRYMEKATHEAKVHTSWINPNAEYDTALRDFIGRILPDQAGDPFVHDVATLARRLAYFGYFNSLSQTLLKMTCPGVPDFYQGTELWDFSLVDPDNRRPVDYGTRRRFLAEIVENENQAGDDWRPLMRDLLAKISDGRIKLHIIQRTLHHRKENPELYSEGTYEPLASTGPQRQHVFAFARRSGDTELLVAVPRLVYQLCSGRETLPLGAEVWSDTALLLPGSDNSTTFQNVLTGERVAVAADPSERRLSVAELFQSLPLALLSRID